MALKLHFIPDPVLRKKARPVTAFDDALFIKAQEMLKVMYESKGIGLAGPQVGLPERIVVMDISEEQRDPQIYINPKILASYDIVKSEEGCLSIPNFRSTIMRSEAIQVEFNDVTGKKYTLKADDLLARCFQHEIDHLDGILFTDHLKGLNKKLYARWEAKYLEKTA